MRSFKILFITFVSLIVASIAFDPSRIAQEGKEGIEDSNAGVPAIPKEQDQLVMMDIEVGDENADAKDEPLQRIKCTASTCTQICRILKYKCGYCASASRCVCLK
ncbi:uncharacterized protein LOC119654437 [Hermetia illucens]|uniref:uncharacterized protein LOC119654437 n=1 Tax=Hermetia illucens TaxID=343691 RepID=UPI0018CC450C|nr:uncharacterized protein LOC119654437 [Hermetia illucens]